MQKECHCQMAAAGTDDCRPSGLGHKAAVFSPFQQEEKTKKYLCSTGEKSETIVFQKEQKGRKAKKLLSFKLKNKTPSHSPLSRCKRGRWSAPYPKEPVRRWAGTSEGTRFLSDSFCDGKAPALAALPTAPQSKKRQKAKVVYPEFAQENGR